MNLGREAKSRWQVKYSQDHSNTSRPLDALHVNGHVTIIVSVNLMDGKPKMTTTVEYLDALKTKTGAPSDYALHKLLGVTRSCISRYRNKQGYFDDDVCLKVASILEIPGYEVLINIHSERAVSTHVKASFKEVLRQIGQVAAGVLFAAVLATPTPSEASTVADSSLSGRANNDVYYVKLLNKRKAFFQVVLTR